MKYAKYIIIGILLLAAVMWHFTRADVIKIDPVRTSEGSFRQYNFFASTTSSTLASYVATTTNATSTNINSFFNSATGIKDNGYFVVAGAKKVEMYFSRGDITGQGNTGTSTFNVQVSPDGTNWYDFRNIRQNSPTTTAVTVVPSVILSASLNYNTATATIVSSLDLTNDTFYAIRCIVVEGTNGEHTCRATAEW